MKIIPKIKLWFSLYNDELKGVLKVFLGIGIFFLIMKSPTLIRKAYSANMDSEAIAVIDTLIQNEGIIESLGGGKVLTKSYDVIYHFESKGKSYQIENHLDRISLTIEQRLRLKQLHKGDSIKIKYPSNNPLKAMLEI